MMGRKKDLVPHFERSFAFICESPFKFSESGELLTPKGRFVETANNQIVPPLVSRWQEAVKTSISGRTPRTADLTYLEAIIKQYVAERVARQVNPNGMARNHREA
jgi:hypothetical protein